MKPTLILVTALTFGVEPVLAQVGCPNPIPDDPSRLQIVTCLREFSALQNQLGESVLKRIEFFTNLGASGGGEQEASCPSGAKLVGGSCFSTGGDFSRPQFGPKFYVDAGTNTLYRMTCQRYGNEPVQAVAICARARDK
jgi:hypothetical protein